MEILDKLPEELVWNVRKYMRHPLAEIMKPCIDMFDFRIISDGYKLVFMMTLKVLLFLSGLAPFY